MLSHRLELRFTPGGKLEAEVSRTSGSPVAWDAEVGLYTVERRLRKQWWDAVPAKPRS